MFDCSVPPPYTIPLSPATSPTCLTRALYAKIATTSAPAVVAIIGYDGGKSSSSSSSSSRKSDLPWKDDRVSPIPRPPGRGRCRATSTGWSVKNFMCVQSYDIVPIFPEKNKKFMTFNLNPVLFLQL
jgi:hypothetical protein